MNTTSVSQATAEQYLDEMLDAEKAVDHQRFIKRFETKYVENFTESRFRKDMRSIREDLGDYRGREFLGCLKGFEDPDRLRKYPGCKRYVWKGIFEKNETLMVVGIYEKDGEIYANEFVYNHPS